MKIYLRLSDSVEELVDALNEISGDISVVEPDGKNFGYYLEFFLPGAPGKYCVFFGDQIVLSSKSRNEILCFLWGLKLGHESQIRIERYRREQQAE